MFRTRIPRAVIIALEAADFSVFSSPTYAKSFLAQYSAFLNVEAALWLDALQPASFISGDNVNPLWTPASRRKEDRPAEPVASGGWFSAVILLALSGGLILAAVQGYEFFESRFGREVDRPEDPEHEDKISSHLPAQQTLPAVTEAPPAPPQPAKVEDDLPKPPPRAIIVR